MKRWQFKILVAVAAVVSGAIGAELHSVSATIIAFCGMALPAALATFCSEAIQILQKKA
jgi:hypothetical protein